MGDNINHPKHYTTAPFRLRSPECIDFTRTMGFCAGNALKYVWRAGLKGDWRDDLAKALWYLRDLEDHPCGKLYNTDALMLYMQIDEKAVADPLERARLNAIKCICAGIYSQAISSVRRLRDKMATMASEENENQPS